ncbi:hypothetical protein E2562_014795 [Oryza meyeriana var. granulata]|uniref:Uncharacterized protein n=1 Tax=Oryza meyeriana var. granulata TaxID=110450 RepID=A0A6G1BWF8_9ORYZ|nr:hypothetical protein E2562_014795 [Oryza meyeriana var. granulata]
MTAVVVASRGAGGRRWLMWERQRGLSDFIAKAGEKSFPAVHGAAGSAPPLARWSGGCGGGQREMLAQQRASVRFAARGRWGKAWLHYTVVKW